MIATIQRQIASASRRTISHTAEVLVGMAALIGAVLRLVGLGKVPPGLFVDEAVNGYNAYSLFVSGRDHYGHLLPVTGVENFGEWASPLLTFLSVPFVGIFGLHVEVIRSVTGVIGVLAVPIVYLLGLTVTRRRSVGVVAAWLLAISPQHVLLSRWAIPPSLVPTMVALTLLLVVWSTQKHSDRGIVAAALVASLTVASYSAMKLYIPLLGIAAVLIFAMKVAWVRVQTLLVSAAILVVIAGPILYRTAFDEAGTRFQQVSAFQESGFGVLDLAGNYLSFFSPEFLLISGDGNPSHTPEGFGFEMRSTAPLLAFGLVWLVYRTARPPANRDRSPFLFLLAALLLYPIPGSLTINSPHTLRAAHLIPLSALLAAMGLVALVDIANCLLRNQRPAVSRGAAIVVIGIASLAISLELRSRYHAYFVDYPEKVAPYFEYGFEGVINYAQAHETEYDDIWIVDIDQAYIYVLFYQKAPPAQVHESLQVHRNPPQFNQVVAFGKYRFGALRQRPPANLPGESLGVLHSVSYPNGRTAFEVTGWVAEDGRRALLIWKP